MLSLVYTKLLTHIPLVLIVATLFLSTQLLLHDPPVWPDEALFTDTALNFIHSSRLGSEIFGDAIPGFKEHVYWMPPLYFYLLAGWIKIMGAEIESVRTLSFLFSLGSGFLMYFLSKTVFESNKYALLATALMFSDLWFMKASHLGRMDIASLFFLLLTFFIFILAHRSQSAVSYLISGVAAGLGVLTHPLGFITPIAISLFLISTLILNQKKVNTILKPLILFLTPIILSLSFWFSSMKDSWQYFLIQYQMQLARKASETTYIYMLIQENLLWLVLFIVYLIVFVLLLFQLKKFKNSEDLLILLGLAISSVFLVWGKEMWYIVYLQPFISLAMISLYKRETINKMFPFSFFLVIPTIVINFFFLTQSINTLGQAAKDYHQFTKQIMGHLPKEGTVFLSVIPDPYFDLQLKTQLKIYEFSPVPISSESYQKILDDSDFLVLNMLPNQLISDYIDKFSAEKFIISKPNGYSAAVIKLKPKDQRTNYSKPAN